MLGNVLTSFILILGLLGLGFGIYYLIQTQNHVSTTPEYANLEIFSLSLLLIGIISLIIAVMNFLYINNKLSWARFDYVQPDPDINTVYDMGGIRVFKD